MDNLKKIKEAERYLHNGLDLLRKAGRENGSYRDSKYVRSACGTAYIGALVAADAFLAKKGMNIIKNKGSRKNVDDYTKILSKLNRKVLHSFNAAYYVLHISGYYDGVLDSKIINRGFEALEELIEAAKN